MGIADKLKELSIRDNTYCTYQNMYMSLKADDRKALDEAWEKGVPMSAVLSVLRTEGIKTSNESIRSHRTGVCKCPKTTE